MPEDTRKAFPITSQNRPSAWGTIRSAHARTGGYIVGALAYALEGYGARVIVASRVRHHRGQGRGA